MSTSEHSQSSQGQTPVLQSQHRTNEICNICYNALTEKMICTPCKHTYCTECFFKWMKESRTCPNCREILAIDNQMSGLLEDRRELLTTINENIASQFNLFRFIRRDNDRLDKTNRRLQRRKHELEYLLTNKKMKLEDLQEEKKTICRSIKVLLDYRRDWEDISENPLTSIPQTYTSIYEIERNIRQIIDESEGESKIDESELTEEEEELL